jgi:hypothetical protein
LINTNKLELANPNLKWKNVTIAVKLASKFLNKMQEHIEDNLIPKDIAAFAKSFFTESTGGGFIHATKNDDSKKPNATQPTILNEGGGGKRKPSSDEQKGGKIKPKKEFSDKGLRMGNSPRDT